MLSQDKSTYSGSNNQLWQFKKVTVKYASSDTPSLLSSSYLNTLGYNTHIYTSHGNQQFFSDLRSPVITYHGHGDEGVLTFDDNTHIFGLYSIYPSQSISSLSSGSLNTTKLFVTFSCYGGTTNSSRGNVVSAAYNKGAQCAIGWTDEAEIGAAVVWDYWVFRTCSEGGTIQSGINNAESYIHSQYPNYVLGNSAKRYTLGNTNQYL